MRKQVRLFFFLGLSLATICLMVYLFLSNDLALLEPQGTIAGQQKTLLVFATILSMVIILPVFALTIFIAVKYRSSNKSADYKPEYDHNRRLEAIWWGVPIVIIFILSIITIKTTHSLDPYRPIESATKPLRVQVVALQWKWLFIYPDYNVASVNYLRIPEDVPVNFDITADAPMNSFWIPKLGGQVYAMSGMNTKLHLMADNPGVYEGYSANISGEGFAEMRFITESTDQVNFDSWVRDSASADEILDAAKYAELSKPGIESQPRVYGIPNVNLFEDVKDKYMTHGVAAEDYEIPAQHHSDDEHGGSH